MKNPKQTSGHRIPRITRCCPEGNQRLLLHMSAIYEKALSGPMACAIHLQITGLLIIYNRLAFWSTGKVKKLEEFLWVWIKTVL